MSEYSGIVCRDIEELAKRAHIVDLEIAHSEIIDGIEYLPNAILPTSHRRIETSEDMAWLERQLANQITRRIGNIAILSCPFSDNDMVALREHVEKPQDIKKQSTGGATSADMSLPNEEYQYLPKPFGAMPKLQSINRIDGYIPNFMTIHSPAGMNTVTRASNSRVGMHFDTFEWGNAMQRAEIDPGRIGVNLGYEPRLLYSAPDLDAMDVKRKLGMSEYDIVRTSDAQKYIKLAREGKIGEVTLRALALRLDPGEAYYAKTELVLHDGGTLDLDAEKPNYDHTQGSTMAFWVVDKMGCEYYLENGLAV